MFCTTFSDNTKLSQVVVFLIFLRGTRRLPVALIFANSPRGWASPFVPVQGIRLGVSACMTLICVSRVHLASAGKKFVSISFSAGLLATNPFSFCLSENIFTLLSCLWGRLHGISTAYWVIFIIVKMPSKVASVPLGRAAKISFCLCLSTDLPSSSCNCCQNDHTHL